jgi:hypothetical protein
MLGGGVGWWMSEAIRRGRMLRSRIKERVFFDIGIFINILLI